MPSFWPKPPACTGCPAEHVGRSYVPGRGPLDAEVALLGQGPGETEAARGQPWVGPAGRQLQFWVKAAGLDWLQLYRDNCVRCWLPANREPLPEERDFCMRVHVWPALRARPLKVIAPVGAPAAVALLGDAKNERLIGGIYRLHEPNREASLDPGPLREAGAALPDGRAPAT